MDYKIIKDNNKLLKNAEIHYDNYSQYKTKIINYITKKFEKNKNSVILRIYSKKDIYFRLNKHFTNISVFTIKIINGLKIKRISIPQYTFVEIIKHFNKLKYKTFIRSLYFTSFFNSYRSNKDYNGDYRINKENKYYNKKVTLKFYIIIIK